MEHMTPARYQSHDGVAREIVAHAATVARPRGRPDGADPAHRRTDRRGSGRDGRGSVDAVLAVLHDEQPPNLVSIPGGDR